MKSDRIALIVGIASLGIASAVLPQSHTQGTAVLKAQIPAAPIVVKASDPPASKVGAVFLLGGQ